MGIGVNQFGMETAFMPGGFVDTAMSIDHVQLLKLIGKAFSPDYDLKRITYLPDDLKARGLDDPDVLPSYHARNDALLIHQAIEDYVSDYVHIYYKDDEALLSVHTEVQNWAAELSRPQDEGGVGLGHLPVGASGRLERQEDLVKLLTSIIYTASVGHATANFQQYDEYGWTPNKPLALRGDPPRDKSHVHTEKDVLDALPDMSHTLQAIWFGEFLSQRLTNSLGDFETQYIYDPEALEVLDEFRGKLEVVSGQIKESNSHRSPPYEYLLPERVPNSIAI